MPCDACGLDYKDERIGLACWDFLCRDCRDKGWRCYQGALLNPEGEIVPTWTTKELRRLLHVELDESEIH